MNEDVLSLLTSSADSIREQLGDTEKYFLSDFAELIKKIPKGIIVTDENEPIEKRIKDRVYFVKYEDTEGYSYKFEDYLGNELKLKPKWIDQSVEDKTQLETTDKSSLVGAINELNSELLELQNALIGVNELADGISEVVGV